MEVDHVALVLVDHCMTAFYGHLACCSVAVALHSSLAEDQPQTTTTVAEVVCCLVMQQAQLGS